MGTNIQLMYIVFLVIFAAGLVVVVTVDTSDQGECKRGINGEILVRQPDAKLFVEKQFCILIQS